MIKSYKIRLIPTPEQEQMMWDSVNASRFVWNWGLAYQMGRFENGEKHLSAYDLKKVLTQLKTQDENSWLRNISNKTLSQAVLDLGNAYGRFFTVQKKGKKFSDKSIRKAKRKNRKLSHYDMIGHPKFKKKGEARNSFYVNFEQLYFLDDSAVLEKIGKVKYQTNYQLPEVTKKGQNSTKFSNPRVSCENGKWILSFGMECENQALELNDFSIGVDLGVKDLAVLSTGIVFKNVNKSKRVKRLKKRLRQKQRKVSRKYHTNGNYSKTKNVLKSEKEVERLHTKLRNIRKDYIHKTTHQIVSMLPKAIVLEDLNVQGMMKNRHLARAISEQNFYEFRRQIEYKAAFYGISVIFADRFYPSSKKCSCCGAVKKDLKLKDRVYKCECGLVIGRDLNAAINLEKLAC